MIRLKNGFEVKYNEDFDLFFRNLLESIIKQSKKTVESHFNIDSYSESLNDLFLKELMDNCIYVTHQLFEIAKTYEEFSKFMITGFLFNSIIMSMPQLDDNKGNSDEKIVH